jgi:hypothetical protein
MIKAETEFECDVLVCDISCMQHAVALIEKGNLVAIDTWLTRLKEKVPGFDAGFKGYYAALAKLLHVWRDGARSIWLLAQSAFGAVVAKKHFKCLPPKCNSSRWGSVAQCEDCRSR